MLRLWVLTLAVSACVDRDAEPAPASRASFDPAAWRAPSDADIPNDSLGNSIRRGLALIMHTPDSLPAFAPGRISCSNCHMNAGRNVDAAPLTGSFARYPKYLDRSGAVVGITDRVNYCFTRSLAGTRLPAESREMQDIVAYLAFLSRGVPVGMAGELPGAGGLPPVQVSGAGDNERGRQVYVAKCQSCHGPDGEGNPGIPPGVPAVWGPGSFSVGASMARQSKATQFIYHNMPWGAGRTLGPREALDVAAYVTSQPRPDSPGKENDWPLGGAPVDVPYATKGRAAYLPPPVLPRSNPAGAIVPPPPSAQRARRR